MKCRTVLFCTINFSYEEPCSLISRLETLRTLSNYWRQNVKFFLISFVRASVVPQRSKPANLVVLYKILKMGGGGTVISSIISIEIVNTIHDLSQSEYNITYNIFTTTVLSCENNVAICFTLVKSFEDV